MSEQNHTLLDRSPALPNDLSETRTIMGADRTLMAWIRTSLSMLSFGFTIYKFLEAQKGLPHPNTPQQAGLFLAGVGTLSMILGTWDYWTTLRALGKVEEFRLWRSTLLIALIMTVAGVVLFVTIAARII